MTIRVLIMAGGTGGHVFPALAVAEELRKQNVEVFWMGTERGIEAKLVPAADIPISYISVQGLRGNGALGWLLAPFKVAKAVFEAMSAIRNIKPDVVMGLGGFASGPGGVAAKLMAKPLVIHEQNAIPGLTNKCLARLAKVVMEGFPNSFANNIESQWVGNPVRSEIEQIAAPAQRYSSRTGAIRLLVLGGSLGARALNTLIPQALALIDEAQRPEVKHQCGQRHYDDCIESYQQAGVASNVSAFIDDMAAEYEWADMVICRAGALTVAELSAVGLPAILVPYPYAVDDHQTHNAAALVKVGGAKLIQENALTAQSLANEIQTMTQDRQQLLTMASAARTQAKNGTAQVISSVCQELAHG
ncbi:undecaprenyldiphospho-muramoylpentapeptide beta-N-acetylglucosaminyltransferase [Methylophaga sp. 41_12_T18]|nr:undecaprenyldiphospho-muramoylpentapeptide beta-N-acetylglucosaminyltransferase [Methylophaga sp. 41_12_T18]